MSSCLAAIRAALTLSTLCGSALAGTYIVDAAGGPGSHFLDIQPAVEFAVPGDVILIRPGTYHPFVVSEGLRIIGQGAVVLTSGAPGSSVCKALGVPAGPALVISGINLSFVSSIEVNGCEASVIFDRMSYGNQVKIVDSSDVRLHRWNGAAGDFSALNSRVEIVETAFIGDGGSQGQHGNPWWPGGPGSTALLATDSRIHFVLSSATGGGGGGGYSGGDGGNGAHLVGGELIATGFGLAKIQGGLGGWGDDCGLDGNSGDGLISQGAVRRSNVQLLGGGSAGSSHCGNVGIGYYQGSGSSDLLVAPDDPVLTVQGVAAPGTGVSVTLRAEPGAIARLNLGATPLVLPAPGVAIEQLATRDRSIFLGLVPASGVITHVVNVPAGYPAGTMLIAQARLVYPVQAEVRRTNSCPLIVQ